MTCAKHHVCVCVWIIHKPEASLSPEMYSRIVSGAVISFVGSDKLELEMNWETLALLKIHNWPATNTLVHIRTYTP